MPEPISAMKTVEEEDKGAVPCQCHADRPIDPRQEPTACQCHLRASLPEEAAPAGGRRSAVTVGPIGRLSWHPGEAGIVAVRQLGFCRAILGAIITALLVGTGFLFILFGLVPAVAVTLALFLPALLPFVLVGLGILFTEDLEDHLGHIRHEWKEVPDLVHPKG